MKCAVLSVKALAVVAFTVAMFGLTGCGFLEYRKESQRQSCISNLKAIEAAVKLAKLQGGYDGTEGSVVGEYKIYFLKKAPVCPAGGTYTYPAKDKVEPPTCSVEGHSIPSL